MNPQRRYQGIRRANRVLRIWCAIDANLRNSKEYQLNLSQALLRTRTLCSLPCCGNPRKWWKQKTRQEIRADDSFKEQTELDWHLPDDNDPVKRRLWFDFCLDAYSEDY